MSRQPQGPTVSNKHKTLSAVFRALDAHTSDDAARPAPLHHVRAYAVDAGHVRLEATDGHALVRVDVPAGFFDDDDVPAPDGYYKGKAAATLLSVGSAPITNPDASPEWYWPRTDQVVPHETMAPGAACAFNASLLSGVLDTIHKIGIAFGGSKLDPVRVQFGQASVDPARLSRTVYADAGPVVIVGVVMPMRL